MRGVVFVFLVTASSAWAEAPGSTSDPYAACLEQRHAIYEKASATDDYATRGRMLAQMPTCTPGMTATSADPVAVADAIAARNVVETQRERPWTIALEPLAVRKHTLLVGVSYQVAPAVGVTLHGGIGRTEHVGIGDTYNWYYLEQSGDRARIVTFTEKQIGLRANYYLWNGIHAGADVTYQHFGNGSGNRSVNPWTSIEGLGVAAFVGWKQVTKEGLTMELQVGPMLLAKQTTTNPMAVPADEVMGLPPGGWDVDDSVHWYSSFMGGYSF
ncbi:MAG: hypothetical protein HOV81_29860 [Kofleriaceae bacterium]|nr:hypothetical protein [Kofleriaceae bacterium]